MYFVHSNSRFAAVDIEGAKLCAPTIYQYFAGLRTTISIKFDEITNLIELVGEWRRLVVWYILRRDGGRCFRQYRFLRSPPDS